MSEIYSLDLRTISLAFLQRKLERETLSPGRKILQEDIQERFAVLRSLGLLMLFDLNEVLKNPKKLEEFAIQSGLPENYLIVLRREVNGYISKPFDLHKIPEVDLDAIKRLKEMGIKNTRQIFEQAYQLNGRVQLSARSGIQQERLLELVSLADLARVYGVGPVFARILYTAEIKNVKMLANSDINSLFPKITAVNNEKQYTKIMPNLNDMHTCVEFARLLPVFLEE